jgi:hypothetical protein
MATGSASDVTPNAAPKAGPKAAPKPAPDFGPTLPRLLRDRFGVRERVVTIVAVALVALVALGALVRSYATAPNHLVYRGGPTFNLQYSGKRLHRVPPKAGELVRIEAHRRGVDASVAASPLRLGPYAGNVTSGLLPVYADAYKRRLRAGADNFKLSDEGSARVNDAQGYQIGFRTGRPGGFTWGRDMLLLPGDENVRDGVVLKLRQFTTRRLTKADQTMLDHVRKAFQSFRFGTDSP